MLPQSELIHSVEGLKLETALSKSLRGGQFTLLTPWSVIYISRLLYLYNSYSITLTPRIHSDEGLTLETSVFESFTVANLPYRPCG